MSGRDVGHPSRGPRRWVRRVLALLLVVALVAGGLATWRYDLLDRWLPADPVPAEPAAIPPPDGVELPVPPRPEAVADPTDGDGRLDSRAVRRALAPFLGVKALGRNVVAAVAPLSGGAPVFSRPGTAIPASTTKLVTAAAALLALGPDHVFSTDVVRTGPRRIVLVGGGDPFLASSRPEAGTYPARADVETLARRTAASLKAEGVRRVDLAYDDRLFTGPTESPRWEDDYVPDGVVSPIGALWVDEGRPENGFGRVANPPMVAATAFADALVGEGIRIRRTPQQVAGGQADRADPATVASVESAPLSQIVERILEVSDNEASEVLLHHVGLAEVGDGSFAGGREGVASLLTGEGVGLEDSVLYDGSGLSRANVMSPGLLIGVLRLAADRPELRAVLSGLPVAGYTGSLADRMSEGDPAGLGRVRAKTGTLQGVSGLAGVANDRDGNQMVFVLLADRIPDATRGLGVLALDNAAAALGACRCG